MTPPENHVSRDAKNTSVRLTPEDHEAIHEISKVRRAASNTRTRKQDILVDALWHFLTHTTGKTRGDILATMPTPSTPTAQLHNVTPIRRPKKH